MQIKWGNVRRAIAGRLKKACRIAIKVIPVWIELIAPYAGMYLVLQAYEERGGFFVGGEWLLPVVLYGAAYLIKDLGRFIEDDIDGCPVARKRFTKRGSRGEVLFKMSDVYEMAEYMAEVEDYCEQYGKYKR